MWKRGSLILLMSSACGDGSGSAAALSGTNISCPAYSYLEGSQCRPLPPIGADGALARSGEDASSDGAVGDSSPDVTSADAPYAPAQDSPSETWPICTYQPTLATPSDAGPIPSWGIGTPARVNAVTRDRMGNVFATGFVVPSSTFYLAKFDPYGTLLWSKDAGGASGIAGYAIATDESDSVIVGGGRAASGSGLVDFGGGPMPPGMFLVKFDRDGGLLFQKGFAEDATGGLATVEALSVLPSGDIVVAGAMSRTIDFGGGPLVALGLSGVFLARFGPCGTFLFARQFSTAANQTSALGGLTINGSGELLVTGLFTGSIDFGAGPLQAPSTGYDTFAVKFDLLGDAIASREFQGNDTRGSPGAPAFDDAGNALLVGSFEKSLDFGGGALVSAGGTDVYAAKLGPKLEYVWAERFGDTDVQSAAAAAVDLSGDVLFTGWTSGVMTLGMFALMAPSGSETAFVAKLGPDGSPIAADVATGTSAGNALVSVDGANALLGGSDFGGPFALGPTSLGAGTAGMVMWFVP